MKSNQCKTIKLPPKSFQHFAVKKKCLIVMNYNIINLLGTRIDRHRIGVGFVLKFTISILKRCTERLLIKLNLVLQITSIIQSLWHLTLFMVIVSDARVQ